MQPTDIATLSPAELPEIELHRALGGITLAGDRARFCVWAPERKRVVVEFPKLGRQASLQPATGGYHIAEVANVPAGTLYHYSVDGGPSRPDPASRFQPRGVHGPSQLVSTSYDWTDQDWAGVSRADLVIYEVHVGTFTEEGNFSSAERRLDELIDMGITAVELMPLADSAGRWNWGYDGVNWFAPRRTFGTPDDVRHFVDVAHAKGLAVILDVVYNHFGPEGNYLSEFGSYLSERHTTPWGPAPNFDAPATGAGLRRFVIANAIHWYEEYHVDALRIDAIHCMLDESDPHIVQQLGSAVKAWSDQSGRPAMLIAESNVYDPELLTAPSAGGSGFDAQWCDDFLHSVFAVLRPGEQLTPRAYLPGQDLVQTLRYGYVYEGTLRQSRQRGQPEQRIDTSGLIYSIQNHDFIGNHPQGKRLHQVTSLDAQRAAAALLILCPAIPMLFMGEEFACDRSFLFFVDFENELLREAVVTGRRREYPQHDWAAGTSPIDPAAHERSRIGPVEQGDEAMRCWYQQLLALRKHWRLAGLLADQTLQVEADPESGLYVIRYVLPELSGWVATRLGERGPTEQRFEPPAGSKLVLDSRFQQTDPAGLLQNHAKVFVQNQH